MLANAIASAVLNVVLLAGIPFLVYFLWHRTRHGRRLPEVARRAGLKVGDPRYIAYSAAFAAISLAALFLWGPPLEVFTRERSAQREFIGLGITGMSIAMALLYGVVKTGFAEELLFRGLIAGSLGRRLSLWVANLLQGLIFLLPHVLVLLVMPEVWGLLPVVFATSLFLGWARIRSESLLGPWLVHAAGNVAMALYVAARTALLVALPIVGWSATVLHAQIPGPVPDLPIILRVEHSPNPVAAVEGGRSGFRFTWLFRTTVTAVDEPVRVLEFSAFTLLEHGWQFHNVGGRPFSSEQFAEWYGCPDAVVRAGTACTDSLNWFGGEALVGRRVRWYYVGVTEDGRRGMGWKEIETLPEVFTDPDTLP